MLTGSEPSEYKIKRNKQMVGYLGFMAYQPL